MSAIGPELPPHILIQSQIDDSSGSNDGTSVVGPQIPPHLVAGPPSQTEIEAHKEDSDSDDDYGPALPPELLAARSKSGPSTKVVGPSFPEPHKNQNHDRRRYGDDADEDSEDDDDVGPMPLPAGISFEEEDGVREFMEREERRRKQIEVCIF